MARSRQPEILADAAHAILVRDPRSCTGVTFIDDEVLAEAGVTDLDGYAAEGRSCSPTSSSTAGPSRRARR